MKTPSDQSSEQFLQGIEAYHKKFFEGKVCLKDMLNYLKSFSPEQRSARAKHFTGGIFKPGVYEEQIALLEKLVRVTDNPTNGSVFGAIIRILSLRHKFDTSQLITQIPAAWLNIGQHVKTGTPLRLESLEIHDKFFFTVLKMNGSMQQCSPVLGERVWISRDKKDDEFLGKLRTAFGKRTKLTTKPPLSLKINPLTTHLLNYWDELFPGCTPNVGLRDFTYQAIVEFCIYIFDPKGKVKQNEPFEWEKVRDAVRKLKLPRSPCRSVSAVTIENKTRHIFLTYHGKKTPLDTP